MDFGAGRVAAGFQALAMLGNERKVRAPQDEVVGNPDRPQGSGKCNRK
jgi:hypothetical protein